MRRLLSPTHSVRFRLTAWYGTLMVVVLLAVGLAAWTLMGSWLRGDLDDQLRAGLRTYSDTDTLNREAQDTAALFRRGGPDDRPGQVGGDDGDRDEYRSLIVQLSGPAAVQYVTPFPCAVTFADPAGGPGTQRLSTQHVCGDAFRVLALRVDVGNPYTGVTWDTLVVAQSLTPVTDTLRTLRDVMLALGAVGVLLALQGGWLLAGRSLRPIERVTDAASAIAESPRTAQSLARRLPPARGDDEVGRLTATFNRMLDRVEGEFERRQRFVADASHELRTPLAAIRGNLDVLALQSRRLLGATAGDAPGGSPSAAASPPVDPAVRAAMGEGFDDLGREAARMGRLLDDLLFLARDDGEPGDAADADRRRDPVRLDEVAEEAVRTARGLATGQRLEVRAAPATVAGDRDRLAQLVWILLDNALRHTPEGRAVTVTVSGGAEGATLAVSDEGDGIAAADLPHVFDRFYRADAARGRASGGSGLGLAIASAIVARHGGTISAESVEGQGATFTVRLPVVG